MDMTASIAPKSDQMNAEDLLTGPRTFTIADVREFGGEQPFGFYLEEFPKGRPFKPSKTARRVMVAIWGKDPRAYVGKRLTLFRDPDVKWAGEPVGGIRISHMSHIPSGKPVRIALTETRGHRSPHVIQPLADNAPSSEPVDETTVARNSLLQQVKQAAEKAGVGLDQVAVEWAKSHDGQKIGEATDLGGLELVRDDLWARAS